MVLLSRAASILIPGLLVSLLLSFELLIFGLFLSLLSLLFGLPSLLSFSFLFSFPGLLLSELLFLLSDLLDHLKLLLLSLLLLLDLVLAGIGVVLGISALQFGAVPLVLGLALSVSSGFTCPLSRLLLALFGRCLRGLKFLLNRMQSFLDFSRFSLPLLLLVFIVFFHLLKLLAGSLVNLGPFSISLEILRFSVSFLISLIRQVSLGLDRCTVGLVCNYLRLWWGGCSTSDYWNC